MRSAAKLTIPVTLPQIETALRAGVPQESRGVVWGKLLKIDQIRTKADFTYSDQLEVSTRRAGKCLSSLTSQSDEMLGRPHVGLCSISDGETTT